jgi:hypothetical protein
MSVLWESSKERGEVTLLIWGGEGTSARRWHSDGDLVMNFTKTSPGEDMKAAKFLEMRSLMCISYQQRK